LSHLGGSSPIPLWRKPCSPWDCGMLCQLDNEWYKFDFISGLVTDKDYIMCHHAALSVGDHVLLPGFPVRPIPHLIDRVTFFDSIGFLGCSSFFLHHITNCPIFSYRANNVLVGASSIIFYLHD
jgi:hypothetical protein